MAESNFTTPEQKNAADRSSGSASEKLEPSLNTLQGETAQTQAEPTIPVREEALAAPKGFGAVLRAAREALRICPNPSMCVLSFAGMRMRLRLIRRLWLTTT